MDRIRADQEEKGNFAEAARANARLLALRKQLQEKKAAMLSTKHVSERAALEARQEDECKTFAEEWDMRMTMFTENCAKQEEELAAKHAAQFEEHQKKLEAEIPTIPKHAADYLNAKRIQQTLIKQRNYNEAHKIQKHMRELEAEEQVYWGESRKNKIEQALRNLQAQQEAEMSGLKKKLNRGLEELNKDKARELETLLRRYQNLKKEMETYQRIEQNKLEGRHSMGATVDLHNTRSLFKGVSEMLPST